MKINTVLSGSMMSRVILISLFFSLLSFAGYAQIEKVIVEKYYISDSLDATDTTLGRSVQAGSVTYRIYMDLTSGSKVHSLYGDSHHPIIIKSTAPFYNNVIQPAASFGYLANKNLYLSTPTLALDSWLTIGLAAKNQSGVLKSMDSDGNFFAGAVNSGGSYAVPGGILNNADTAAGIPLTSADGMMPAASLSGSWLDMGFRDAGGVDSTVFGPVNIGSEFISYNSYLQQTNSVGGSLSDTTVVLVAQLTTTGDISFKLNVELEQFDGVNTTFVRYVSSSDSLQQGEIVSPLLVYPQACGCTDPDYFEYDPVYSCSSTDSCKTRVHFGCMDSVACNYDPEANFNVPELCCYPGLCQDRDLATVCPDLSTRRNGYVSSLFPIPAKNTLNVVVHPGNGIVLQYSVMNIMGMEVLKHYTGSVSGEVYTDPLDISNLRPGVYFLKTDTGHTIDTRKFIVE